MNNLDKNNILDVTIIGGGPAGITAAIYGKRSGLKVNIIEKGIIGGNIANTHLIENYPALMGISGFEFSMKLEKHLKDLEIDFNIETVLNISKNESLSNELGLNVFEIEMLYKKKDVAVVGGGNTALESITVLSEICNNVYVFVRGDKFRGEQIVVDNILKKENVHIMYNTSLTEIKGDENFVTEITTTNGNYNVDGVFITIGTNPNSELFKDLVSLNNFNEIITDHQTMETSFKNIYAIGDVRDTKIRQILTGMSDAIYAIHDIISNNSKLS